MNEIQNQPLPRADPTVAQRMAKAEIEAVLQKYDMMMVSCEVLVDGNTLMRQIMVMPKQPIVGVNLNFAQDETRKGPGVPNMPISPQH